MGSVYKQVQSKEDLLVALATRMYQRELALFDRILGFELSTPEKIVAISLLDRDKVNLFRFDAQLDNLVANTAILQRASSLRVNQMLAASKATAERFTQCFVLAVDRGEFLSGMELVEEMNIAAWSITVGYLRNVEHQLQWGEEGALINAQKPQVLTPNSVHIRGLVRLLNAYQWSQPLTEIGLHRICRVLQSQGLR